MERENMSLFFVVEFLKSIIEVQFVDKARKNLQGLYLFAFCCNKTFLHSRKHVSCNREQDL